MTNYNHIIYEKQETVARVKLNRPRYLNAQSQIMLEEMDDAFQTAIADKETRVIILSGEGDHFSSGHDLGTPEESSDQLLRGYPMGISGVYMRMEKIYLEYGLRWRDLPKPTIAMVHGYCIWGGWQIASSMDLIVAAEDTMFLPGFVEYFSVPWDIGPRKAKEILFQSRFTSAQEALELGFVNRVVPKEKLEAETMSLAERIAETDPFLTRMAKLSINQAQDAMGFRLALQAALSNFIIMAHSGAILSAEEATSGKRSLSPVDKAFKDVKVEKEDQ
jgi:enoyl-CoA hydratase